MFIEAIKKINIIFAIIMLFSAYSENQKFLDYANEAENSKYDDLIEYFNEVVINEYCVERWEEPMYISVTGDYTQEDYAFITSVVEKINSMGVMPGISMNEEKANCTVLFGTLDELEAYYKYRNDTMYQKDDWWAADMRTSINEIYEASIGIASDVTTQEDRNYMILLCITQAIGLQYGSDMYPDSICYSAWTGAQFLSELDYILITMLYLDELHAGIFEPEADEILKNWARTHISASSNNLENNEDHIQTESS